jgi:hypothetical protein
MDPASLAENDYNKLLDLIALIQVIIDSPPSSQAMIDAR